MIDINPNDAQEGATFLFCMLLYHLTYCMKLGIFLLLAINDKPWLGRFSLLINYGSVFSSALDLNPDYMKVRLRRAHCYEHEDRLEEALEGDISNQSCLCLVILDTIADLTISLIRDCYYKYSCTTRLGAGMYFIGKKERFILKRLCSRLHIYMCYGIFKEEILVFL